MPNDPALLGYLYCAVKRNLSNITSKSRGSVIKFITKGNIADYEIAVPPIPEMDEIINHLNQILRVIDANKRDTALLKELRDVLLLKLMSGEIDVSKVDLTQLNSHLAECIQVINQSAIEPNLSPYLANQPFAGKFFVCCSKSVFGSIELFSIFFFPQFFNSLFEWPVKLFAICLHRVQDNLVLINRKEKRLISINELGDYRFRLTFEHESRFHRKGLHLIELQMKPQLMLAFKYMRNSGSNLLKKSRIGQQLKA